MDGVNISSEYGFERYLTYGVNLIENPQMDTNDIKKFPILNIEKLNKNNDSWMCADAGNNQFTHQTFVESSQYELSKALRLSAGMGGNYEGFGMSYNVGLEMAKSFSQNTKYGVVKSECQKEEYQTILTSGVLCNFLTDECSFNVGLMSPKDIFNTYGTHLITKFLVGGKLNVEFMTKSHTAKSSSEISQEAEASYLVLTGTTSTKYEEECKQFSEDCVYKIHGKGGNLAIIPLSVQDGDNYNSWSETVKDSPAIYEIKELIPIWELFDGKLKTKLEKAYFEMQTEYFKQCVSDMLFITDLRVERRKKDDIDFTKAEDEIVVKFDALYGGKNANCNEKAGGDHIYILYRLGNDVNNKITDIKVNYRGTSTSKPCIGGYTHINVDLNDGAGGRYIYIDYKKENTMDKPGFHALGMRTTTTPYNSNWKMFTDAENKAVDLNKGAGGDYLYLFGYIDPLWDALKKQIKDNEER